MAKRHDCCRDERRSPGLSQTSTEAASIPWTMPFSCFVNLCKSEEVRNQIVLIVYRPAAGKAEAFPQPQHCLETGNCSPCSIERLKAAYLWHVLLHPEIVALNALLKVFGDIMDGIGM